MAESSPQTHQPTLEEGQDQVKSCLQTHPSTLEEARAFTNSLPGGIAGLTLPSLPKPSLTWPSMPPASLPQQQGSSVARPMVAGPVVTSAGPARSTLTSLATPVTAAVGFAAVGSAATVSTATATGSTVDTKSPIVRSDGAPAGTSIGGGGNGGVAGPVNGVVPTISNVLVSVNLDCRLDLKVIALHSRNSEYNPRRFSAVVMRIRDPKSTALIFASGKMVVTGCKSEADARLAARKFARIISKLGYAVKFTDFKVHNVVATCDVGFPVALQRMTSRHTHFSNYDPEFFPGLVYRMIRPKVVFMIFHSGKVVMTGGKTKEEIYQAFEMMHPILRDFHWIPLQ